MTDNVALNVNSFQIDPSPVKVLSLQIISLDDEDTKMVSLSNTLTR